jgi:hypothetical protein
LKGVLVGKEYFSISGNIKKIKIDEDSYKNRIIFYQKRTGLTDAIQTESPIAFAI